MFMQRCESVRFIIRENKIVSFVSVIEICYLILVLVRLTGKLAIRFYG